MDKAGERTFPRGQGGKLGHRVKQPPNQAQDNEEENGGAHREVPRHPTLVLGMAADVWHDRTDCVLDRQKRKNHPVQDFRDRAIAGRFS